MDDKAVEQLIIRAGYSIWAGPKLSLPAAHGAPMVQLHPMDEGCELACQFRASAPLADILIADLEVLACGEPGDTRIVTEGESMTIRRRLVDPTPGDLRDSCTQVQRVAALTIRLTTLAAETLNLPPPPVVPEPTFPDLSKLVEEMEKYLAPVIVQYEQAAFATPDPSTAEVRKLRSGTTCQLVRREGDWARVLLDDRSVVYTDGRTLVPQGGS